MTPLGGAAMTCRRAVTVVAFVLALAGCGDDEDGGASAERGATEGAKEAPTLEASRDAKGTVTMCAGKDTTGALTEAIERFNEEHADQGLKVVKQELAADATEVRNQFIQRAQARSGECDVLQADIIWIAEFAQQGWLLDMSDYASARRDEFIPSTLSSFDYDGKLWGLPQVTGAGLLYRRTDQAPEAPATWQELYEMAARESGFAFQGAPYEGLTCNFVELSSAAGGRILSEDGTKAELDSPENLEALELMVDGMKSGGAVKATVTYMEEPARLAFEAGKATFMRNWSYAYSLAKEARRVKDVVEVTPLPPFEGGGAGGVLGGNGPVIHSATDNPEGSMLWIDHWTSEETLTRNAAEHALPPTMPQIYDDPAVVETIPYADELRTAVENATSRPVSPVYSQISQAVYDNVNKALAGQQSPKQALERGQEQIERALAAF
jgi:multiple sugar transport system substrate-binding protein